MSRFWLRLVSVVSLAAYLLANTNVSFAMDIWVRHLAKNAQSAAAASEKGTSGASKCKHCSQNEARSSTTVDQSSDCQDCHNGPCDDRCPCCPDEPGKHKCPCPGGCALCSNAKVPCVSPLSLDFQPTVCLGDFVLMESFAYLSPFRGSLDRPPRI